MSNLGTLVVRMALEMRQYRQDLGEAVSATVQQMGRAQTGTAGLTRAQRDLQQQAERTADATDETTRSLGAMNVTSGLLGRALGGLSVGALAVQFVRTADSVTVLNNQLKLATGSTEAATRAYDDLYEIAQRSRVSFTSLGSTYAQIRRSTQDTGISSARLLTVTEAIGNAMTVSGGAAAGMDAALIQLSQGFASGTLRGEELNSVMEQTPRLAQAIAAGMSISLGQLRELGAEGKLTSEAVINALESQAAVLRGEVASANLTVGQSMTVLGNASIKLVGQLDEATGASGLLARGVSALGSEVDRLSEKMQQTEQAGGGGFLQFMNGVGSALGRLTFGTASLGVNLFNSSLNLLTGGVFGFNTQLDLMPDNLRSVTEQTAIATRRVTELEAMFAAQPESPYLRIKLAEARALVLELQRAKAAMSALDGAGTGSVGSGDTALARAERAAYDARAKARDEFWAKNQTAAQKMAAEMKAAREAMGDLFSPEVEETIRKKFAAATAGGKGFSNLAPENIAKAALAQDLSSIKSQSAELISVYDDAEKVMQAMRSAGLIDESDYYASKLGFLNLHSEAQAAALEQEIARLEQEKLIGRDRIDNERQIAEARAKLKGVKTNQQVGAVVLGIQDVSAQQARTTEVDKFFADAQKRSDERNEYAVEGIRQSLMSQAQIEAESHAARLAELTIYNASRLEGEASANALIEEEKRRHASVMASIATQSDQIALNAASQATDQMYSLLKQAGMEQTALGKVAFLASKALAVAQIIMQTNVAAASALALPPIGLGPVAGLPLAGFIKTMGYASAGVTAGLAIAEASAERGYDIPEGVNPVVQTHAKEMILPRAQADVIRDMAKNSGGGGGGGGAEKSVITIVNNTSAKIGKVTERQLPNGERALILEEAVALVEARLNDPNSKTSRAMQRNFSVQRSR
jgi:tape measure domain-containing protein